MSSIRLKHSSLSCSAASIIPTLSWARLIYDVRWDCVVESVVLSETWWVSWWESLSDGELFGSGCCPGSVRSVLCSSGITGVIFGKTVSPGKQFVEGSLELDFFEGLKFRFRDRSVIPEFLLFVCVSVSLFCVLFCS